MSNVKLSVGNYTYVFRYVEGQVLERQSSSQTSVHGTSYRSGMTSISSTQTDYYSAFIYDHNADREIRIDFAPDWDPSIRAGNTIKALILLDVEKHKGSPFTYIPGINYCFAIFNHNSRTYSAAARLKTLVWDAVTRAHRRKILIRTVIASLVLSIIFMTPSPLLLVLPVIALITPPMNLLTLFSKKEGERQSNELWQKIQDYFDRETHTN